MRDYYSTQRRLRIEKAKNPINRMDKKEAYEFLKKELGETLVVFSFIGDEFIPLGIISSDTRLIRWQHYGSSAVKKTKSNFDWLLDVIFKVDRPIFIKDVYWQDIEKEVGEPEEFIEVNYNCFN